MANSANAQTAIDQASDAGNLQQAIVIGKDADNGVQLFIAEADKEALIVLLSRAKDMLVRSLDT